MKGNEYKYKVNKEVIKGRRKMKAAGNIDLKNDQNRPL